MSNIEQARAALRELGVRSPSEALIENWLRAAEAEGETEEAEAAQAIPGPQQEAQASHTGPSSHLEPGLRAAGTLERPPGPRKPGRPRIIASWFPKVAETMADGTSLKMALSINGLHLSKGEIRACYRNRTLRDMYTRARNKFMQEHYGRRPTLRAKFGRYL